LAFLALIFFHLFRTTPAIAFHSCNLLFVGRALRRDFSPGDATHHLKLVFCPKIAASSCAWRGAPPSARAHPYLPISPLYATQGGYFQHALFNEHTKGNRIKDLSYLNRDLRHVILVDTNPNAYSQQKYNGIAIKPWDGDLNDTELLNLVPFLEAVFKEDIQDVREVRVRVYVWDMRGSDLRVL